MILTIVVMFIVLVKSRILPEIRPINPAEFDMKLPRPKPGDNNDISNSEKKAK